MRKSILKVFPVVVIFTFLFVSASAAAENQQDKDQKKDRVHVSIGYNQYYMWWDPVWSRMTLPIVYTASNMIFKELKFSTDSNFVYNPVISIKLPKGWSISGSFLYSEFISSGSSNGVRLPIMNMLYVEKKLKVKKYDADLLLQYNINEWCKIYIGPKYQGYYIDDALSLVDINNGTLEHYDDMIDFHSAGGGVGVGFMVHILEGFYFLPNISGILLYGKDVVKANLLKTLMTAGRQNSVLLGGIGDASFAYYIDKIWTTVTLGFKCQYLYYNKTPKKDQGQKYDLIFGPHLGFAVTF